MGPRPDSRKRDIAYVNDRAIEKAARALCRLHGYEENASFEGEPVWKSYLPEARASLEAAQADVNKVIARRIN